MGEDMGERIDVGGMRRNKDASERVGTSEVRRNKYVSEWIDVGIICSPHVLIKKVQSCRTCRT